MKIVINDDWGGFGLSEEAYKYLGLTWDDYGYEFNHDRTNPKLIECVEKLGDKRASGKYACLKVVEIPDGVDWEINDYDGCETVHEKHRIWG
jgi:hypothetical protein